MDSSDFSRSSIIIALGGVAFTAIVALYDIYIGYKGNGDATVSMVLIEWSKRYPFLPFVIGMVMGHLFWK